MKKNKNFSNFLEEAFPVKDPFSRKENGIFHNFIKWLALRFSFFFYRIGISANILDTIALIFLFPIFSLIFFSLNEKNIFFFIIGYLCMCSILFIDFIDGPLATISKYQSKVGDELDNLCPEVCRISSLIIIGYISSNNFFFILACVTSIIINSYVLKTGKYIAKNYEWLNIIFLSKMSMNGIRLLVCLIMPICSIFHIYSIPYSDLLFKLLIIIYFIFSLFWILITLKEKTLKD